MKNRILNKIQEMDDNLREQWNNELDRWNLLNCTRQEIEHNMDIIEGKTVILEQLKEFIEKI